MFNEPRTGGRVVDCSGLENPKQQSPQTPDSADFCGLEHAQDAMFATCSTSRDGTRTGTVAALYVETDGCYFGLPGVEPWDELRDARTYAGPHPIVAHPPCQRWGRFWGGNPMQQPRLKLGDDKGCFTAALAAVRKWGGIIEHPEASHAWSHFGLNKPPKTGGWISADFEGGWTCCVEQGHYGHLSRKATWLYAHSVELPELIWGPALDKVRVAGAGFHTKEERAAAKAEGRARTSQLPTNMRNATPLPFRDLLLSIARSATRLHHSEAA